MTELRPDNSTASLDTNIRLLIQRVNICEKDLHRLGDTVRMNTRELQSLQSEVKATDTQLDYRLNAIEQSAKELSGRVWGVGLGVVGTVVALIIEIIVKR